MAEKKQEKKRRKLLTDKQSYRVKNEYLTEHYSEVTPMAFYRDMFPVSSFERRGHHEDTKANGILTVIDGVDILPTAKVGGILKKSVS